MSDCVCQAAGNNHWRRDDQIGTVTQPYMSVTLSVARPLRTREDVRHDNRRLLRYMSVTFYVTRPLRTREDVRLYNRRLLRHERGDAEDGVALQHVGETALQLTPRRAATRHFVLERLARRGVASALALRVLERRLRRWGDGETSLG